MGFVGYLSYQSGQQAISDLAHQLTTQTGKRVNKRLDSYMQTSHGRAKTIILSTKIKEGFEYKLGVPEILETRMIN